MSPMLDHVILLLPYRDVVEPPSWLTDHFVISSGGRHADGKTENRLVLFQDGTYLELIAFIDDSAERRRGHWWDREYGVVDWALASTEELVVSAINRRLSQSDTGASYLPPQEGGRVRPDGQQVRWRVTFPEGAKRGAVPFWCNDVTPRNRRVPITEANTTHPCGATGISGILIESAKASLPRISNATAAILDVATREDHRYQVAVPHSVSGAVNPSVRLAELAVGAKQHLSLSLLVQSPKSNADICHDVGDGRVSILFEQVH